jgi:hypothetical protein
MIGKNGKPSTAKSKQQIAANGEKRIANGVLLPEVYLPEAGQKFTCRRQARSHELKIKNQESRINRWSF